eukprot:676588-Pelagomonas_calceolata.AAC.1
MMCKVTLLFLFGFLKLRDLSLVMVLVCWALPSGRCSFQSRKGVGIREEFKFNKMNVPVLRKDLSRIN